MRRWALASFLTLLALFGVSRRAHAEAKLAEIFGNGTVLQQGMKVPVWGFAAKGEKITVSLNGQELSTTADADGKWRVDLAPMEAGGPFKMIVQGQNKLERSVYVGDVWVCAGQSNMAWTVANSSDKTTAIAENTETLRYTHKNAWEWKPATGGAQGDWSAVGYYFGKALSDARKCPIGLIQTAVGGTPAESWVTDKRGNLFNGGIRGYTVPFAIKGVIWYQGEANVPRNEQYTDLMEELITGWRKEWGQGDFPFLFVQLARFGPRRAPGPQPGDTWAMLRDAQTRTLRVPNTAMVVSFDVTDGGLHPANKKPTGERLALAARRLAYGEKIAYQSPVFERVTQEGTRLVLHFTHVEDNLSVKDSPDGLVKELYWLMPDNSVKPADARVEGKTVVIERGDLKPRALYYAWGDFPVGNLYCGSLPVSPFKIDQGVISHDECSGNVLVLASTQPLDPAVAGDAASYELSGCHVKSVELDATRRRIKITPTEELKIGQEVVVRFPGFKSILEPGTTMQEVKITVLPGKPAFNPLREFLVGEVRKDAKWKEAVDQDLIGEKDVQPSAGSAWRKVSSRDGVFSNAPGDFDHGAYYAHTYVFSTEDRNVQLWLGSKDGVRVLVNGNVVHTGRTARNFAQDQDHIEKVPLKKGWNRLLLMLATDKGPSVFSVRIRNEEGRAPTGISYQADLPKD